MLSSIPSPKPGGTGSALRTLDIDIDAVTAAVARDGIAGLPGSFSRGWAEQVHEDFERALALALSYPRGTVDRGPNRYYFAVHPQQVRGFVDLVTHPAVTELCTAVLGADYKIVELGFDVPLPGAVDQPWHRDFAGDGRHLSSLAFNVTTVDVSPDMGPFEIAPGTHLDDGSAWPYGMFPTDGARYDALASRRCPQRGDMSVRTGLTIHRGTANVSDRPRGVLILGAAMRDVDTGDVHDLHVTPDYHADLPEAVRNSLACTVVDELRPIVQKHDIEGLMMGGTQSIPTQRGVS